MKRPSWVDKLATAYGRRKKTVIALTGGVQDIFPAPTVDGFIPLEQLLYQELQKKFLLVKVDPVNGISFFTAEDERKMQGICARHDAVAAKEDTLGDLRKLMALSRNEPLTAIEALKSMSEAVTKLRAAPEDKPAPLCIIIQFAAAAFPAGGWDRLNELDRQRLTSLLQWINNPLWSTSDNLLILVSDTRAELNAKVLSQPSVYNVEVDLPGKDDRALFVERRGKAVVFEPSPEAFVGMSAGLKLTQINDMIAAAEATHTPITRADVLEEVNVVLKAELGDIIKVKMPEHGPDDVVGGEVVQGILEGIFKECEDPETAVAAILVSGPNGGGKTYRIEAFAKVSGRIVIELAGLRSSDFGGTEKLFELLLSRLRVFGNILIEVDEAHTAFGSVHQRDVHETEKRLAGNFIKMMSDPSLLGKVLWVLMTSRPDALDPDVKSRCPEQLAIFDPEGEDRRHETKAMFEKKGFVFTDEELSQLVEQTATFSKRDFAALIRKSKGKKVSPLEMLRSWKASNSIARQRKFQSLLAAQHCSYPQIVPPSIAAMGEEGLQPAIELMRMELGL